MNQFLVQESVRYSLCHGGNVPLVFCLLTKKTAAAYKQAFKVLKEEFVSQNLTCEPAVVYVDLSYRCTGCLARSPSAWLSLPPRPSMVTTSHL